MKLLTENISKVYGKNEQSVVALNNANIAIGENEFVAVIGPSGSGKSTFLHIISGLDVPTQGVVYVDGTNLYDKTDKELSRFRRQEFGFIFQQFNLVPILTARENIILPVLLDKKQADKEYFDELCNMLQIADRLEHLPNQLSGGQQQRVAIARALIAKPNIIFADEPTGNLDKKSGQNVMELLAMTTHKLDKSLVMITHDENIAKLAERKIYIEDGILTEI